MVDPALAYRKKSPLTRGVAGAWRSENHYIFCKMKELGEKESFCKH